MIRDLQLGGIHGNKWLIEGLRTKHAPQEPHANLAIPDDP